MARAKNRGLQQSFSPSYTVRRWRLGEYIRLSKEDLKKGKDDSNSVINQRDLLNDFYQKHIGEFESVSEYVDDGHTGTDANRENFQRLLSDVMSGKINCVVVKDLSRFARNYSDAGSLIDNLFVQMGVRFISLAENVDSYLNPDSVSSIIVPITNVMNDQYCYQTSKKIRQVFDYKRRNGQYIGAFAPYGYVKHPKDKHRLIIDPDAAEIVKLIFSLFLKGTSKRAIALYLNEHGVPSPSAYKLQKGIPVSTRGYDDPMWGARMIHSILTNPTYTGDLAQGRSRVKSYKVHEVESVPREEWVEVAGTHEAITLDELLEDKQVIDEVVSAQVKARMTPFGIEVASLGVKDIVLPGDMKAILSQLVEAEKSAQANVIRRREETAATRSLLNTAKVMENNPVALRLKELETLERVAERIDKISVFGGLDQVLHGLVNIKG